MGNILKLFSKKNDLTGIIVNIYLKETGFENSAKNELSTVLRKFHLVLIEINL